MRRFFSALALMLPLFAALPVHAAPIFDFTVTGDGHVFAFSLPDPAPVYDHPHAIFLASYNIPGSVDGTGGYTFAPQFDAASRGYQGPNFAFSVNPLPPGTVASPFGSGGFSLYGPTVTSLVSDVPVTYNPVYNVAPYLDLMTYTFVPGSYAFTGTGADGSFGSYSVVITEDAGSAVTPEPGAFWLLGTGALGAAAGVRRRWRRQ